MWIILPILLCLAAVAMAAMPPAYPEHAGSRDPLPSWLGTFVPVTLVVGLAAVALIVIA